MPLNTTQKQDKSLKKREENKILFGFKLKKKSKQD